MNVSFFYLWPALFIKQMQKERERAIEIESVCEDYYRDEFLLAILILQTDPLITLQ